MRTGATFDLGVAHAPGAARHAGRVRTTPLVVVHEQQLTPPAAQPVEHPPAPAKLASPWSSRLLRTGGNIVVGLAGVTAATGLIYWHVGLAELGIAYACVGILLRVAVSARRRN